MSMKVKKIIKTAKPVYPNSGVEAAYRKSLQKLIDEMCNSAEYYILAKYKSASPELAEDALPSSEMKKRMDELSKKWIVKFNKMSVDVSKRFVGNSVKSANTSFKKVLKDAGWTVEFKMTRAMQDAANAAVVENVSLIKSIPRQYFQEIEGIVMRGYTNGRDLKYITDELKSRYGVTHRRAAFIANDQANKLTAATIKARRKELGITEAIWRHSHAGKEPRKSHVAADMRRFNAERGCLIDGEYIQPGEKINCRCVSESVLPF